MPYRKHAAFLIAAVTALTLLAPIARAAAFTQVAVGGFHACATTSSGAVWCWGDRNSGQLGDGSEMFGWSDLPVSVSGLSAGATRLAAGLYHTCAVLSSGALRCWGGNGRGQLGNGSTTDSAVPVDVPLAGVTAVSAGAFHTCAVAQGSVYCWGANDRGQLGTGSTTDARAPAVVPGLSNVASVAAGGLHTCAVRDDGSAACWGWNAYGQLGSGSTSSSVSPVPVAASDVVFRSISAGGYFTCGVSRDADAYCWGRNAIGELGTGGDPPSSSTPVPVAGLDGMVASVAAGNAHACARTTESALLCWGYNNDGQLGIGSYEWTTAPLPAVDMGSGVQSVSTGVLNTCAVTTRALVCTGDNDYGQLGDGTSADVWEREVFGPVVFPDSTPPAVAVEDSACAKPGNDGWCRSPVAVTFSAVDGESGVATPCSAGAGEECSFAVSSSDGARTASVDGGDVHVSSGAVCDAVGNCADPVDAGPFKIDTVAPSVTCPTTTPTFLKGQQNATVSAAVHDATSGPASASVGAVVSTATVGTHQVALTGADVAGNTRTATCEYQVVYAFDGFFAPIDNPPALNKVSAGRVIPVKFSLTGDHGLEILAAGSPVVAPIACADTSLNAGGGTTQATSNGGLKYDAASDTYTFSWKTDPSWSGTCRAFDLRLNDGTSHVAWFQFR